MFSFPGICLVLALFLHPIRRYRCVSKNEWMRNLPKGVLVKLKTFPRGHIIAPNVSLHFDTKLQCQTSEPTEAWHGGASSQNFFCFSSLVLSSTSTNSPPQHFLTLLIILYLSPAVSSIFPSSLSHHSPSLVCVTLSHQCCSCRWRLILHASK